MVPRCCGWHGWRRASHGLCFFLWGGRRSCERVCRSCRTALVSRDCIWSQAAYYLGGAIAYMDEVGNLPVLSGRWRNPSPLEHYLLEKIAFPLTTSLSTIAEDRLERLEEL